MSLRIIAQRTETTRKILCCKAWTIHIPAASQSSQEPEKRRSIYDLFFTWDAGHWQDYPYQFRQKYNAIKDETTDEFRRRHFEKLRKDQQFRETRYDKLGANIAAATFIVHRQGKVKFQNHDRWSSKAGAVATVPTKYMPDYVVEGIDASGMTLLPVALDNFVDLEELRYLNLSNVCFLTDWHLAKLYRFSDTLEFLDLSKNDEITDEGLMTLFKLKNLKVLNISKCPGIKSPDIVCTYLTEFIPNITIVGLDTLSSEDKGSLTEREFQESRFLNIGEQLNENLEEDVTDKPLLQDNTEEPVKRIASG